MVSFLETLRRFKPITRFGRFSLWVLSGYLLLHLIELVRPLPASGLWHFLLGTALLIVAIRYLFKATRALMQKLLWRLRRRLLVTYVLIGVVPVFLLLTIMLFSGYLIFGNLARFFVNDGIDHLSADLDLTARVMLGPALDALSYPANSKPDNWERSLAPFLEILGSRFSRVWVDAQSGGRYIALEFKDGRLTPRAGDPVSPDALKDNTTHIFDDHAQLFMASFAVPGKSRASGWLLLRAPLDEYAFKSISKRIQVTIAEGVLVRSATGGIRIGLEGAEEGNYELKSAPRIFSQDLTYTNRLAWYDFPIQFTHTLRSHVWKTDGPSGAEGQIKILHIASTWVHLARHLFSVGMGLEGALSVVVLLSICTVFLLIELAALLSAVLMTRTITGALHNLHAGAQHILHGDFSHRIPVKERDQLGSLAGTFNSMAAAMERLLKEEAEKQRLDSELAVAREVQQHLFPNAAPRLSRLQIAGACRPARTVSGDYYDYLVINPTTLGLALADVSGKGVSAALLMASLQAALRSHLAVISHPVTAVERLWPRPPIGRGGICASGRGRISVESAIVPEYTDRKICYALLRHL